MFLIKKFIISSTNNKEGKDHFGNEYFESKNLDYLGQKKRFVIYKGLIEPSKIPPLWHAWLHHLTDIIPTDSQNYTWQHDHMPNLTGTKFSYHPNNKSLRSRVASDYNSWKPN